MTNSSSQGFIAPVLDCAKCGLPFALSLVRPKLVAVDRLADPFLAKCPMCEHQASYPKSAIQIRQGVARQ
jgi:hypothetical protein